MSAALLDLVLPTRCVGCAASGTALCSGCAPVVGRPFRHRPAPTALDPARLSELPRLYAAGRYEGATRSAILAYKERGRRELGVVLGGCLAAAVAAALGRPPPVGVLLVPVPSRAAAARARGGDHVRRLAIRAAAVLGRQGVRAVVLPVLRLSRTPRDATGLTATERAANVRGAFAASQPPGRLPRWPLVLVDDLVTTGSTLADTTRALTTAGLAPDAAAVIAATIRRTPAPRRGGETAVEGQLSGRDAGGAALVIRSAPA